MSFNLKEFAKEQNKAKDTKFTLDKPNKTSNAENIKKSWAWYQTNVRNVAASSGMGPMNFMGANIDNQKQSILPGQMICYMYDPKTKDKLPYYDNFPMVLPFAVSPTHFTGLNIHYLPPKIRAQLLNKLMVYATNDKLQVNSRLRLSWDLLKNAARFPEVSASVKQYLFSHVKSNFVRLPPKEWEYAIWLPLEKFKKASNEQVWNGWRNK